MKPGKEIQAFKEEIVDACKKYIQNRMQVAEQAMKAAQESANSEEKSSAGDKYETGRAMSQIDRDRNAKQLAEAKEELNQLLKIDLTVDHHEAGIGALIDCGSELLFIAAGIGVIQLADKKIIVLSPKAPLARSLAGKTKNDFVEFNGRKLTIRHIY